MEQLDTAIAVIAAVVLILGLLSNLLKRSPAQESVVSVLVGIVIGPFVLGWVEIADWGGVQLIMEQAARLTLAVALMAVALRIRKRSLLALWRPAVLLLSLGMVGMWLTTSALAGWLLGLPVWMALAMGAVLTPTDPVVASSIVTGPFATRNIPHRVRQTLSLESGANDGLAYGFVLLPVLMITHGPDGTLHTWFFQHIAIGVGGALALGGALGYGAAWLLRRAEASAVIETYSSLSYTIALSLFTLGSASLLNVDALIAVFVAGLVHNLNTARHEEHEEENIQEAIAKLFTLPMFVLFGAALPLDQWIERGWPLAAFAVLVLLLRRPPVLLILYPALRRDFGARDVAYLGWFGPIGVAAIYYAALAWRHLDDATIWYGASAVVLASILGHGMSAAPLTRLYAKNAGRSRA